MINQEEKHITDSEFDSIFKTYYKQLCNFANLYVKDIDIAEDVVQETFTKFWYKSKETIIHTSLKSYLFRAVKNGCLDWLAKNKKYETNVEIENVKNLTNNGLYNLEPDLNQNISNAIQDLPERCRDIFILSRIEGFKHKEIAEKLNIAEKTVEVQIRKASLILRDKLKDYAPIILLALYYFDK